MKPLINALLSVALTGAAASALAASSVDLSVTGSIVPTSCTPTMSTANVDFGRLSASDLQVDAPTYRPGGTQYSTLRVSCLSPTVYAIRAVDNRSASLAPGLENLPGLGLGLTDQAEKVGGHYLLLDTGRSSVDGRPAFYTFERNGEWSQSVAGAWPMSMERVGLRDTGAGNGTGPVAIQNGVFGFHHWIVIAPAKDLTLTEHVALDGNTTLELMYL